MTTVSTLERRIDRHMRDSNEQINLFKHELQSLKPVPKSKVVRQSSEAIKANPKNKRLGQISKATTKTEKGNEKSSVSICQDTKASKISNSLNHPNDDELKKRRAQSLSVCSSSHISQISETDSVMTKINFNGSSMRINCNPLTLIQFLLNDLKKKLKDFVPDDDKEVSKVLHEINYAIKQARLEKGLKESSTNQRMTSQTTQTDVEVIKPANGKQLTSKDVQTNLHGDEVEKLREFQDKHLEKQLKWDVNLRHIEEMFTLELNKSDEKIVKLTSEISSLQRKLNEEISTSEKAMLHRVDLKIEEMKGEIKFLMGAIGETRNHNLIDDMHKKLAQTNKKLNDVKRKCTTTAKQCLQVQLENLLINSTAPKTNEIGHELRIIKSNFGREIAALKNAVSGDVLNHHRHASSSTASSSSLTSPSVIRKLSSESITSPSKRNEISFDDKLSKIIDDGTEESVDESSDKRKRLMMKQREIDNAPRRNHRESSDANESIGDTSDGMRLPQDDSFN